MKKIIPTLTYRNICKDELGNYKGQHCAVGWLQRIYGIENRTRMVSKFFKFLNHKKLISKDSAPPHCSNEEKIFHWNDNPKTLKTKIATALNEFNRLLHLEKAKVARKRKATLAAKKK